MEALQSSSKGLMGMLGKWLKNPSTSAAFQQDNDPLPMIPGAFPDPTQQPNSSTDNLLEEATESQGPRPTAKEAASLESQLRNTLQSSIQSCGPSNTNRIFSAPQIVEYSSKHNMCDVIESQDLTLLARPVFAYIRSQKRYQHRVDLFIASQANREDAMKALIVGEGDAMRLAEPLYLFGGMIVMLAEAVFQLPMEAIHLVFDENSSTIAFNRGKSLFFNYAFFRSLHGEMMKTTTPNQPIQVEQLDFRAISYWYLTFCHELGHNFVR
jgi:hypothetical protein